MSDEGMMTEDIEECLHVVINAIAKSDVPVADVTAWCAEMTGGIASALFATLNWLVWPRGSNADCDVMRFASVEEERACEN